MPANDDFDPSKDLIPDEDFDPGRDVIPGPGAEGFRVPDGEAQDASFEPDDEIESLDMSGRTSTRARVPMFSPSDSALAGAAAGASLGFQNKFGGLVGAVGAKGKQALQSMGVMDPDPSVSDAIDTPGATINGRVVAKGQHVPATEFEAPAFGDVYEKEKKATKKAFATAEAENPKSYLGAEIVGGTLLPMPGTGKLKGAKAIGKMALTGAGVGTLSALGHSDGDLSSMGVDAAIGAGLGGAFGGAGEGLAQAGSKTSQVVRDYVIKRMAAAKGDAAAKAAAAIEKELASKLGAYRSAVQAASRDSEVIGREAAAGAGDAVSQDAQKFLSSPEAQALREQIVGNKLQSAPERLAEMARLKADYEAAKAAQSSAVAGKTADLLSSPLKKQIWPRLLKYSGRVIPPAIGAAAGSYFGGGIAGTAGGALIGGIASATLGSPTTALANALQHPSVRLQGWNLVEKTLARAPEKLGKYANYFTKGANPAVTFYVLSQRDPEFRDQMAQLEADPENATQQ